MASGQPGFFKSSHLPSISLLVNNLAVQFMFPNGCTVPGNFVTTQLYADHSHPSQFICIVTNGGQNQL
jgi:hypothetical protein